jgi:hypothetical protein
MDDVSIYYFYDMELIKNSIQQMQKVNLDMNGRS